MTAGACGSSTGLADAGLADAGAQSDAFVADAKGAVDAKPQIKVFPELWYSVDERLVQITLDPVSGNIEAFRESEVPGLQLGQNALTMLDNGGLLGARLSSADNRTYFYYIPSPPRNGGAVVLETLGVMPDSIMLEGLYTDCDGRVYAMDTGSDVSSAAGNRLLLFTGDFLAGNFDYQVVSDLATATVADIDDMGPAIVNNEIRDNPSMAIDSGTVYDFNFETGTGTVAGTGGTWGIHALGKELFNDKIARLYLLNSVGELFSMDPVTFVVSASLGTGPTDVDGLSGWSGLAGPLTECESGFIID